MISLQSTALRFILGFPNTSLHEYVLTNQGVSK